MIRTLVIHRWSLLRHLLPSDVHFWLKALLLAGVAIQLGRLLWVLATPVGPFGDWRPQQARLLPAQAQTALIAVVDPFFRHSAGLASERQFPSLDLKLFGVREERGAGGGSAILGPPDGEQRSHAVGDEVAPGVRLAAVFFDFVVLDSGGQQQKLYMEGSGPSAPPPPAAAPSATAAAPAGEAQGAGTLSPEAVRRGVSFAPRSRGGRITGIIVNPGSEPGLFASTGFDPGDVIVAVNGARISSSTDLAQLQSSLVAGARLSFEVERGAATVPVALNLAGQ